MPKFTVYVKAELDEVYEVEAADGDEAMSEAEGMFIDDYGKRRSGIGWTSIVAGSWEYSDGDDGMDDGI